MSKAVLISIRPEWCEKIASGKKTIEVRKTRPKLTTPFKCYIYCTVNGASTNPERYVWQKRTDGFEYYWNGKVIGEFVCDTFVIDITYGHDALLNAAACMSDADVAAYCLNSQMFGWHISNLKIYDTPMELADFTPSCNCGDGGECVRTRECECYFQRADYNQDGSVNIVQCTRRVKHPPQSWCYVEELQ